MQDTKGRDWPKDFILPTFSAKYGVPSFMHLCENAILELYKRSYILGECFSVI